MSQHVASEAGDLVTTHWSTGTAVAWAPGVLVSAGVCSVCCGVGQAVDVCRWCVAPVSVSAERQKSRQNETRERQPIQYDVSRNTTKKELVVRERMRVPSVCAIERV